MMPRTEGISRRAATAKTADQQLRLPAAEAHGRQQGHAHGKPDLGEELGQLADVGLARAGAHHFVQRAVEGAEHPREGVAQLDVGVSPEGLGHEARLLALGAVLLFAVTLMRLRTSA